MKATRFLLTVFAAAFVATSASAQQTGVNPGKFSIHAGATALVFGGESFGGIALSLGFLATPKDLFMFEFNNGFGPSDRIGSYSYVTYREGGSVESGTRHDDGKVFYAYNSIETLVSYSRLLDISPKWKFRVGPAIGVVGIKAGDKYNDSFSGEVEGLPEPESTRLNAFTGGVLAGFRWNFSPRGSFDINYLLSGHGKLVFEEKNLSIFDDVVRIGRKEFGGLSHRFNFTVGWRVGKRKQ